jgi:phytoene dehydrogenase-like protein
VVFHTGTDVAKILTDAQGSGVSGVTRVKGLVTTRGIEHTFDAVVSNEDAVRTHRELVGGEAQRYSNTSGAMSRHVPAWCCTWG